MKIILLALTLFSLNALAKDVILFIGGGGEPKAAKETQFDGSLEGIGDFYSDNEDSYKATISFNGGHEKTEILLNKIFDKSEIVSGFTAANYNKIVDDMIKQLSSNPPVIPSGRKILIFINSHGSEQSSEKTHSISTSSSAMTSMNTGGAGMVSLDKLKVLADLAEKKNVKLGIIDGSCHAGSSLALANTKTCVVAASGPNHYSYSDFAEVYSKKMKKGKNLEELFFDTIDETEGKGFPMISTPAGIAVQDELYPYLTPYMFYHDEYRGMALDKIDTYLKKSSSVEAQCTREDNFKNLKAMIKLIENTSKAAAESGEFQKSVDLSSLENKLVAYKKTQDEYLKKLSQLDLSDLDKIEIINTAAFKNSTNGYTHRELLSTNFEFFINVKRNLLSSGNLTDSKREQAINLIEHYKAALVVKDRIIRENPKYVQQQAIIDGLKTDNDVGFSVAAKIMKESRDAYNMLYKIKESEMLKQKTAVPNPCKDFVL